MSDLETELAELDHLAKAERTRRYVGRAVAFVYPLLVVGNLTIWLALKLGGWEPWDDLVLVIGLLGLVSAPLVRIALRLRRLARWREHDDASLGRPVPSWPAPVAVAVGVAAALAARAVGGPFELVGPWGGVVSIVGWAALRRAAKPRLPASPRWFGPAGLASGLVLAATGGLLLTFPGLTTGHLLSQPHLVAGLIVPMVAGTLLGRALRLRAQWPLMAGDLRLAADRLADVPEPIGLDDVERAAILLAADRPGDALAQLGALRWHRGLPDARAWGQIAECRRAVGDLDGADRVARVARERWPDSPHGFGVGGELRLDAGDPEGAASLLGRACDRAARDVDFDGRRLVSSYGTSSLGRWRASLALALARTGRPDLARQWLERARAKLPPDPPARAATLARIAEAEQALAVDGPPGRHVG